MDAVVTQGKKTYRRLRVAVVVVVIVVVVVVVVVVIVVVVPTRRISDGVVFEHLSTSNGVFAVEILQFCRFPSRRCQAQNVSFGTTRAFRVSLWEFADLYVFFCVFAEGINYFFSFFTFLCPDSCSFRC